MGIKEQAFYITMRYHDTRIIGSQGEMLASVMLQMDEIFRVQLLGETVEAFDIYVEINDKTHPYPFLVQEKNGGTGTCSATIGVG